MVVVLAAALAGCTSRPGPEVLAPVAAVADAKILPIYVATTRARDKTPNVVFTSARAGQLNFAEFKVSIPPGHKPGDIEWPKGLPDPRVNFATVEQTDLSAAAFRDAVAPAGRAPRRGKKRKVLVFIHGYNNNFQESLYRLAQIHVDAHVDGTPILFAWPSQGTVAGYAADQEAAANSRDALASLLTTVASSPQVGDIMVLAHSMGTLLTVNALQQLRLEHKNRVIARLGRVVLAAPDIDVEVFRSRMQVIGPLRPPMTILVSKDDKALLASSILAGARPRVGALDIADPRVRETVKKARIQIVDISRMNAGDSLHHGRFIGLAAMYPRLQQHGDAADRTSSGTFVFDSGKEKITRAANASNDAPAH